MLRLSLACLLLTGCPQPSTGWLDTLPEPLASSILWSAEHERGNLTEWDFGGDGNAGGGVFNTGGPEVGAGATMAQAHSGSWAAEGWISNAFQAQNGSRAVRLMRWTDTHWFDGGDYFPDEAYYSAWFYFPHAYNPNKYPPWDPGDGGWWNLFQFKSDDAQGESQPICALNLYHDDATGEMYFYLYSKVNPPFSFEPVPNVPIPVGQWVHLEMFYKVSASNAGRIRFWMDGVEMLDLPGVQTVLPGGSEKPVWGIGNYTDHIDGGPVPGSATLYYDDAAVSTERLSGVL